MLPLELEEPSVDDELASLELVPVLDPLELPVLKPLELVVLVLEPMDWLPEDEPLELVPEEELAGPELEEPRELEEEDAELESPLPEPVSSRRELDVELSVLELCGFFECFTPPVPEDELELPVDPEVEVSEPEDEVPEGPELPSPLSEPVSLFDREEEDPDLEELLPDISDEDVVLSEPEDPEEEEEPAFEPLLSELDS